MKYLFRFLFLSFLSISFGQTKSLTIEDNHSSLSFSVDIAGGITKVIGRFLSYDLRLTYIENDWTKSQIEFTIDIESIDTGIKARDNHLKTDEFFDIEKYPTISFKSIRIRPVEINTYVSEGELTMHGITKQIHLPFEVTSEEGNTIGIKIEHSINRLDFGVGKDFRHTTIPNFISDDIVVNFYFWTKRDKRLD